MRRLAESRFRGKLGVNSSTKHGPNDIDTVGVKLTLAIATAWKLSDDELRAIIGINISELCRWRQRISQKEPIELSQNHRIRCSHLAGIQKSLETLYIDEAMRAIWIHTTNPSFENQSPIDLMQSRYASLEDVNNFLKACVNNPGYT